MADLIFNKPQPSFTGGEFAPSLWKRTDIQKYGTGLRTAKNFIVHKHGGISNRPGTGHICLAKTQDKPVRLIPFVFNDDQAYVLEFSDNAIRYLADGGLIEDPDHPGTAYTTATTWGYSVLRSLDYVQSADTLFLVDGASKPKELARLDHAKWSLADHVFSGGPFMKANLDETLKITPSAVTGTAITLTPSAEVFKAGHVGSLFQFKHSVPGQSVGVTTSGSTTSDAIGCGAEWRLVTSGSWSGTISIKKSTDNGVTYQRIRDFRSAADLNHNVYGEGMMNSLATNFFHLRNPIAIAWWPLTYPGFGHISIGNYVSGFHRLYARKATADRQKHRSNAHRRLSKRRNEMVERVRGIHMPRVSEAARTIFDAQMAYSHLRIDYWLQHNLYSWQWYAPMAMLILPYIIWWKLVDKKRLLPIAVMGLMVMTTANWMDQVGSELGWWYYPYKTIPIFPQMVPVNYAILPVGYMLLYQWFVPWLSYLIAATVMSAIMTWISEPVANWMGIYQLVSWHYSYSFPIYVAIAYTHKRIVDWLITKSGNKLYLISAQWLPGGDGACRFLSLLRYGL